MEEQNRAGRRKKVIDVADLLASRAIAGRIAVLGSSTPVVRTTRPPQLGVLRQLHQFRQLRALSAGAQIPAQRIKQANPWRMTHARRRRVMQAPLQVRRLINLNNRSEASDLA